MDLPISDTLLDLAKAAWVAIPAWAIATSPERPKQDDRSTGLVVLAAAGACIVIGWPLAALLEIDSMAGYVMTLGAVATIAGALMFRALRRNPELDSPLTTAKSAMITFATGGISALLIDDAELRLIVLAGAVFGTGLSVGYFLRIRRELRAQR